MEALEHPKSNRKSRDAEEDQEASGGKRSQVEGKESGDNQAQAERRTERGNNGDEEAKTGLQQRARMLESPSSAKVLSYQAPRDKNNEDVQEKAALPQDVKARRQRSDVQ